MNPTNLDEVRRAALDRIERSERAFKMLIALGGILEGGFLLAYVLLADWTNRVHLLIGLAAIGVYTILVVGLFVLGAHVSRCSARVLQAIELIHRDHPEK
jgi:hypothetical protein